MISTNDKVIYATAFMALVSLPIIFYFTMSGSDATTPLRLKVVTQNTTLNLFAGPSTNTHVDNITKYEVIPVRIYACTGVTLTGVSNDISAMHHCQELYASNTTKTATYVASADATSDATTDWLNFVSSTDRARLTTDTEVDQYDRGVGDARFLNWIVVDWIKVIRIQANLIAQNDNDTAFTRTPTSYAPCYDYLTNTTCSCSNTNFSSAFHSATASQVAAVQRDQRYSAHRMHQPFAPGKKSYALALAFNVKKLFKLTLGTECGRFTDSAGYQLDVPFPPLAPVWYDRANTSSVVMKESYSLTGHAIANVTYRLDLYYVSTDADKAIHGVDFLDTFTTTTAGVPRRIHQLFSHVAHNTTYASFYNHAGVGVLFSLLRRADSSTVMQCTWCTSVANTTMTVVYNGASTVDN